MTEEQFLIIAGLLSEIRDALVPPADKEPASDACPHPEQQRVTLGTFSNPNHWICSACKFESKT